MSLGNRSILVGFGVPAVITAAGMLALGLWIRGYLYPDPVPARPLGVVARPAREADPAAPDGASGTAPLAPASESASPSSIPTAPTGSAALPTEGNGTGSMGSDAPKGSSIAAPVAFREIPGSWPGFRGPNRDNISPETVPLARGWNGKSPPLLWSAALGEGYASPAVYKGRVFLLDYDQQARADVLRCFSFENGQELWRQAYPVVVKRNHGMSRTIPAVTDEAVVTLGPKCHVLCADPRTGAVRWRRDLVREFGATVPEWYAGQCPLIDGGRLILATGGKALLAAFDLATGKLLWQTPNPRGWKMTHSSVVPMTFAGKRMYIYCGSGGVAGVSAPDGRLLWETTDWTIRTATVPTPVPVGEGKLFLTGGYNAGSMMVQLEETAGRIEAKTLFRLKANVFGSDQQTPIFHNGYLYGVIPGGQLACLDLQGRPVWKSGSSRRFGLGPYAIADGMIYALDDRGTLSLVEASPKGFREISETKILDGHEAWGPLVITGGRLIARDLTRMVCLNAAR